MKTRTVIALTCTLAWGATVGILIYTDWDSFKALDLNEKGDFLAGFVSPVFIIWLIIGYFQQGEELQQNTEALRLQGEELKNSVKEQQALVEATRRQVALMEEARIEEKAAERSRAKLRLQYSSYDMQTYAGENVAFNIALVNAGANASKVHFSSSVWKDVSPGYLGQILCGETITIRLGHKSFLDAAGAIEIDYLDGLHMPSKLVCNVNIISNVPSVTVHQVKRLQRTKPSQLEEVSADL